MAEYLEPDLVDKMMKSIAAGDVDEFDRILNLGLNPNSTETYKGYWSDGDLKNWSLLMEASRQGQFYMVKRLVNAGADVNAQTGKGVTALNCSINSQNHEMIQFLIDNGADPTIPDLGEGWASLRSPGDEYQNVFDLVSTRIKNVKNRVDRGLDTIDILHAEQKTYEIISNSRYFSDYGRL